MADAGLPIGSPDRGQVLGQLETPLTRRRVVAVAYDMEDNDYERALWAAVREDPEGAVLWSATTTGAGTRIITCGEMQQPGPGYTWPNCSCLHTESGAETRRRVGHGRWSRSEKEVPNFTLMVKRFGGPEWTTLEPRLSSRGSSRLPGEMKVASRSDRSAVFRLLG